MRKLFIALLIVALGGCYYYLYPPKILERKVSKTLSDFETVMNSQDRAKIAEALNTLLTDSAQIQLNVRFFSIAHLDGGTPVVQPFPSTAVFIQFVDNILFTLTEYHFKASLDSFALNPDHSAAQISFSSHEWGDGPSYYGGMAVDMRFTADTNCDGKVIFTTPTPKLDQLTCEVLLHSVPKQGEADKLQNPEALGQFLR